MSNDTPDKHGGLRAGDESISEVPIHRYDRHGRRSSVSDQVVRETRIELVLNDEPLLAMLCLPQHVEELALGFLYCEGILTKTTDLPRVSYIASSGQVHCTGSFDEDLSEQIHRRWVIGTGCGGGGTARDMSVLGRYQPLPAKTTIRASDLSDLGRQFQQKGELFRQTGGVHACALATAGHLELFAEDVGRHNAFDKVIGMALRQGVRLDDKLALTTGRISAEIVTKAIAARIQILASISAATGLAIDLARRFNLSLIGFLRGHRMNVYTAQLRVTGPNGTDR
jgi:FdhD protein